MQRVGLILIVRTVRRMCGIVIEVFVVVRTNDPFDDTGSELNAELRRDGGFVLFCCF